MADDDLDDHALFKDALKGVKVGGFNSSEVFNVVSVYNGVQTMEYLLKRGTYKTSTDPLPDFIVLDLNMPVMDGFDVLKEIRKQNDLISIPVYVLTTSRDELHKQKCRDLGCAGFFSKPPSLTELRAVVQKMLSASPE